MTSRQINNENLISDGKEDYMPSKNNDDRVRDSALSNVTFNRALHPVKPKSVSLNIQWGSGGLIMMMVMIALLFFTLGWLASAVNSHIEFNDKIEQLYEKMVTIKSDKVTLVDEYKQLQLANGQLSAALAEVNMENTSFREQLNIKKEESKVAAIAPLVSRGTVARNYNLIQPSHTTAEEIDKILEGTGLHGLGQAYIDAETKHGVNALFLLAISMHESGNGTSKLAIERNNLFGWQAYDSNINAAKYFDSKEACIDEVAASLKKNYLTPGGPFFKGYTTAAVNIYYATDINWGSKVTNTMIKLAKDISDSRIGN